jgi:CelD/BcsL family acetyltransferase involved in cellulose biosynthesis
MSADPPLPTASLAPIVVDTIDDVAHFAALRQEWNELVGASASNCVFLTWEWLYTWWKHLASGRRLCILAVRAGDRLTALLPLALKRSELQGPILFETAEFLGTGTVGSDYLDVVIRRGHESESIEALADALSGRRIRLVLAQVRRSSSHSAALAARLQRSGWRINERETSVCPYIDLSLHNWESYLDGLGSSHRYNFRRRLRQLSSRHELKFEQAGSEDERSFALEALFRLHHRRWSERGGSDAFQSERLLSFHREFSGIALQLGWLRLVLLRIDGEPAASVYGLRYGATFYFYQSGFEPGYAKQSVGLVALGLTIKRALDEGASEFDFLHGDEAYKFHWARDVRVLGRWDLYPPHLSGAVYQGLVESARAARSVVRRMLPRNIAPIAPAIERRKRDAARIR